MVSRPVIALDVLGGDGGAPVVIAGAEIAKRRDPDLCFHLYGREEDIRRELAAAPGRSEGRRVGQECVSTGRSRWSQYHLKKNNIHLLPIKEIPAYTSPST